MNFRTNSVLSISALAFCSLLFTTSCKKDNKNPNGTGPFSANLNGVVFQPIGSGPNAIQGIDDGSMIHIAGGQIVGKDTLALQLSIADTAAVNKPADLSELGGSWLDYYSLTGSTDYSSAYPKGHGTLTITSWDKTNKKIAGTFSGVMYDYNSSTDSVKFSGQFNTNYVGF